MDDKTLRERLIRLAHDKPELRKELLPLLKEDTERMAKTARGNMMSIDMKAVAKELGASAYKVVGKKSVYFYKFGWGNGAVTLHDNGGEINITHSVPVIPKSVPFWSTAHPGGIVGPKTLAYRLETAVKGGRIDYQLDLDK